MVSKQVLQKKEAAATKKKKASWNKKTVLNKKIAAKKKQLAKANLKLKTVIKMVKVDNLLTNRDVKYMKENGIATIAIMKDGEKFMVSKQHSVPKTATIVRNRQGQVTGARAIASG